jgi:DNA polymerase-3 subunit delta'
MKFEEVLGQVTAKSALLKEFNSQRVGHARLILGNNGRGSLALALAYAQLILCENPAESDSCGVCDSCRRNTKLIHPELYFSFPVYDRKASRHDDAVMEGGPWAGNRYYSSDFIGEFRKMVLEHGAYFSFDAWKNALESQNKQLQVPVWESRKIVRTLSLAKQHGGKRVFLLWLPEYLNQSAANTLLKVIEEPPPGNIFLFVANHYEQILPTIASRLQLLRLPQISIAALTSRIMIEKSMAEKEAMQLAFHADGNLIKALGKELEEQLLLLEDFKSWIKALSSGSEAFSSWVDGMSRKSRESQKLFLAFVLRLLRGALMMKFGLRQQAHLPADLELYAGKLTDYIEEEKIDALSKEIDKGMYSLERNANSKILFHNLSMSLYKNLVAQALNA